MKIAGPIDVVVLAVRFWLVMPIFFAAGLAVFSPTYWQPMYTSVVGWVLLFIAVNVIGISLLASEFARRLMMRGGRRLGLGILALTAIFFVDFVAMWIVFLGPALILLMRPS